jgi:hypothetical protein
MNVPLGESWRDEGKDQPSLESSKVANSMLCQTQRPHSGKCGRLLIRENYRNA